MYKRLYDPKNSQWNWRIVEEIGYRICQLVWVILHPQLVVTKYFLYLTGISIIRTLQATLLYLTSKELVDAFSKNYNAYEILFSSLSLNVALIIFIGNMMCDILAHGVEVHKKLYVESKTKEKK